MQILDKIRLSLTGYNKACQQEIINGHVAGTVCRQKSKDMAQRATEKTCIVISKAREVSGKLQTILDRGI